MTSGKRSVTCRHSHWTGSEATCW